MKKKFLLILSLPLLLASITGCNASGSSDSNTSSVESSSESSTTSATPKPTYETLEHFRLSFDADLGENEVIVKKYKGTSSTVNIPAELEDNGRLYTVTTLDEGCFNGSSISAITLPDNITSIGKSCFANCKSLTSFSFPKQLKTIGNYAFSNTGLKTLNFNNDLKEIGEGAFYNNTSIEEITLPNNIEKVGWLSFKNCNKIKKMTVPFIGESKGTHPYLAYLFGAENNMHGDDVVPTGLTEVTITGKEVSPFAFYGLTHLEKVNLSENTTKIGSHAFEKCTGLMEVNGLMNVTHIDTYAFYSCTSFLDFELSNELHYVGDRAFSYDLLTLTEYGGGYYLGNKDNPYSLFIRAIPTTDYSGFKFHDDCSFIRKAAINVISMTLPSKLKGIAEEAFYSSNCTSIIIPEGVDALRDDAFGASKIVWAVIPSTVKISYGAFSNKLTTIYYHGTEAQWNKIVFAMTAEFDSKTIYFYSETTPTEAGNYWHYVDNVPTAW